MILMSIFTISDISAETYTYDINDLLQDHAERDWDWHGLVGNWSLQRVVVSLLEQVVQQPLLVHALVRIFENRQTNVNKIIFNG